MIGDTNIRRSPLLAFACCAALTVALLTTGAVVFAKRYHERIDIEIRSGRLSYLDSVIVRLNETRAMCAKMAAATGDPAWEMRYRAGERPLDAAIKEARSLAPDEGKQTAQEADAADTALDAMEEHALALSRAGTLAAAQAVLDASYDARRQIYTNAIDASMAAISAAASEQINEHHRMMIVSIVIGATALAFVVALWLHVAQRFRRYLQDRSSTMPF